MNIYTDYSLLKHNTFGIKVKAKFFVSYGNENELLDFLGRQNEYPKPFLHIGSGSNLLFTKDFEGTVLHSEIKFTEVVNETDTDVSVRAGSGVKWDDFCDEMVKRGFYGVENLSLIPGEVGASAVQNIGAYGVEVKDVIETVEAVEIETGKKQQFSNAECRYAYRDSIFKNELKGKYIITAVVFRLSKQKQFHFEYGNLSKLLSNEVDVDLKKVRQTIIEIRQSKLPDPAVLGNAGSFFKNPMVNDLKFQELYKQYPEMPYYMMGDNQVKIPAAWLIEQCGWKGKTFGGAAVYENQPLVLVNQNHASADDIVELSKQIVDSVSQKFGIAILPEVNFI